MGMTYKRKIVRSPLEGRVTYGLHSRWDVVTGDGCVVTRYAYQPLLTVARDGWIDRIAKGIIGTE